MTKLTACLVQAQEPLVANGLHNDVRHAAILEPAPANTLRLRQTQSRVTRRRAAVLLCWVQLTAVWWQQVAA